MSEKLYGTFEDVGEELIGVLSAPDIIYEANYNLLFNRPKINGVELEGDKSWSDLGLDLSPYAKIEDVYSKDESDGKFALKSEIPDDFYSKAETDELISEVEEKIPTDFYTKAETDEKIGAVEMTAVQALNTGSYANQRIDNLGDTYYTKAAAERFNRSISAEVDELRTNMPTNLSQLTPDATHRVVTDEQIASWNAKSEFDGDYNSLENKPTIPSKVAELSDASEYAKKSEIPTDYATQSDIDTALNSPMSDVATVEGVGYDVAVSGNSAKIELVGGRTIKQGDSLVSAKVDRVNAYPIPSEIQQLDGYGLSVSDEIYNYVDFARKKFVKRVASVDLATLSWRYNESDKRFYSNVTSVIKTGLRNCKIINTDYEAKSNGEPYSSQWNKVIYNGSSYLWVHDWDYTSGSTFKDHFDDSNKMAYFELDTPEEIDVSAYLPDDVFVKADGSVIYHSDSGLAVPYRMQTGIMSRLWETAMDKGGDAPAPSSGGMELLFEGVTSQASPADLSNITDYHAILISIGKGAIADSSSHVGVNLWLVSDLMAFGGANSKRFDTSVYGSYTWCTFTSDKQLYCESTVYPYITVYGIK